MRLNEMVLRHQNKIVMPHTEKDERQMESIALAAALEKNLYSLGYCFSDETFSRLTYWNSLDLGVLGLELVPALRKMTGADKSYKPMYPNFPKGVFEEDERVLLLQARLHYLMPDWLPDYEEETRSVLAEHHKLRVLTLGTYEDAITIFTNLISSKTSISEQDYQDIETFMRSGQNEWVALLPPTIPYKEIACFICTCLVENGREEQALKYLHTATDVLRFVVSLSHGDISLATPTKFCKMKRPMRRFVMKALANCNGILEDMFHYREEWIRIGEIIHPWEFKQNKYDSVRTAFHMIRNEKKPLFFAGQAATNDVDTALISQYVKRPGDFARNLDRLLRKTNDDALRHQLCMAFSTIASKVSIPVLLQVRQHFIDREQNYPIRVFFPKGQIAKTYFVSDTLEPIPVEFCREIQSICDSGIKMQIYQRPSLGKVYIDPTLANYVVPFSQRSASSGNQTLTRGSRINIAENTNVIRAFIHWTNNEDRQDVDLSATFLDDKFQYIEHVSYTNLRNNVYGLVHSGDITNGGPSSGRGVAEFIDVDIQKAKSKARYLVFQVYNFTQCKFNEMTNCHFGWMEREAANSGEIFEPTTVKNFITLSSSSTSAVPVIFDLETRELIWCDMSMNSSDAIANNLENNFNKTTATVFAMVNMRKPDLYTLLSLHASIRGIMVDTVEEADTVFTWDNIDISYIMNELL